MGQFTANISRNMHDWRTRYISMILQQGVNIVDADFNDSNDALVDYFRFLVLGVAGDGSPNNGFKVVGTNATNDFTIKGGDGTFEGAGLLFVKGQVVFLASDVTYKGTPASGLAGEDQRSIFPRVTGVTYDNIANETVITDSAANYSLNELVGRNITPDVETPANSYTIVSNTATTIRVSGDQTANVTVGKRYRLELTTPTANRADGVYVNIYFDEVDSTEDANLLHVIGGTSKEAARRKRVEATIFVREDTTTYGNLSSYTDSDGNKHIVAKIATINRVGGDATIQASMVNDLRKSISPGGITAPVGTITAFAGSTAPSGWLICDGSSLNTGDYTDLFNVIGYTYGGSASTFNLPDLRGKSIFGVNSTDTDFQNLGQAGGTKDSSHTHTVSGSTSSDGSHSHGGATGDNNNRQFYVGGANTYALDVNWVHDHAISADGVHSHTFSATSGSGGSANGNLPPYLSMNYIIKF